jgi:hypothetical protein
MGGMEVLDGSYLDTGFATVIEKSAGWLVILFSGEVLTATAMGHVKHEIERAVVLSLFIPLLISGGGNSALQATSLIIHALALEEIRLRDWWRVISREVAAGVMLGAILGVVGFTRIMIWQSIPSPSAFLASSPSALWPDQCLRSSLHVRPRPGQRIRPIRCDASRRDRPDYLLYSHRHLALISRIPHAMRGTKSVAHGSVENIGDRLTPALGDLCGERISITTPE